MITIGIDPGTAITGYGIIRENPDGSLDTITYGVIITSTELPMPKRLQVIYQKLSEIIHLHRPDHGAVEKLFFHRNVTTAISVGQGRGVAILALAQADTPVAEYTPLQIKQAVAGYGAADKNQVQQMVRALLGLNEIPRPDDAADALAIAICHLHSAKMNAIYQDKKST